MSKWSLLAEFLALSMLSLMFLYFHEKRQPLSFRRRVFYWIFALSISSVVVNILCVYTISHYAVIPPWINQCLNVAYFILVVSACSAITLYTFDLILEHVYQKRCYKIAVIGLGILTGAYACLALTNPVSKLLFFFTPEGEYVRGPLNRLGYAIMAIEVLMVLGCYLRNRSAMPPKVVRVIHTLPPIAVILAGFQLLYPEILFNGVIFSVAAFTLYSNFQTCQIEEDYLTHLGNRKAFFSDLSGKLRSKQHFHVISVSLRQFGMFNEKYDHAFGDNLLFTIGKWFDNLSDGSRSYRYSGVCFAAVFPYSSEADSEKHFQEICQRFSLPWSCQNVSCNICASVCDLVWTGQSWTSNTIMQYLELMTEMSKTGADPFLHFSSDIAAAIERTRHLEDVLRSSIRDRRFTIVLQPLYHCARKTFCCAEALIRLNDYDGTPIPAGEFIPIAEKSGLIDEISWIVLEKVCSFLEENRDLPLESLSINLSMQQFQDPSLLSRIESCLQRFQILKGKLKIEITERVISQDLGYAKAVMERLSQHGIGFYLDDFGTGYSNFSVVMQLPFECIKLDRSLLTQLIDSQNNVEIVRDIISLFHNSGFRVACEGIETASQSDIVTNLGADLIQGFYYARPMEPKAFSRFIQSHSGQHSS